MSLKIRAAAVVVATSLIAVPLAGTAFAQEGKRGHLGGTVFNDLNGDGVRQDGEPGIEDVDVSVKGPDGQTHPFSTDSYGNWAVKLAPYGEYEVSYVDPKLGNTTPSSVKAVIGDGDPPAVGFGVRGGAICGVVWNDANSDGRRQEGEGPVADRMIHLVGHDRFVETGADGVYCFDGLAAGEYKLFFTKRHNDTFVLTRGGGDSKFDWLTGVSQPVAVGKGKQVKGIDAGLMTPRADQKAVQLVISRDGQVTDENTYKVGDVIEIYGSAMANGNAPESLGGTLTLPEGVRIESLLGGLGEGAVIAGQQVHVAYGDKRDIGLVEFLGVRVVVEKELTGAEIKWQVASLFPDVDPSNDVLIRKINAAVATAPQGAAPNRVTPEATKTAGLANTGVDPVAASAIGLGALTLGGLALFAARRRRRA